MEYLLDIYVFRYLPFTICPNTRKNIISVVIKIVTMADWLCKTRELQPLIEKHPTLVISEFVYSVLWLLSLFCAFHNGSRYVYTWIGVYLLAFFTESIKFFDESMNTVFYSQTMLTFMGMRTPFYLLCGIYHTLFYISYVIVKRIHLKWWGEAAANGLLVLLLSLPLHVMGTKLLWWQWYDGDPRLMSAFYSVPLVVLAWYAILGTSFNVSLYLFRKGFLHEKYDWKRFVAEFICVVGASLFTLCLATLQYIIFFHILHDIFRIHSVFSLTLLLIVYAVTVLKALFSSRMEYNMNDGAGKDQLIKAPLNERDIYLLVEILIVAIHFLLHMLLAVFSSPENIVSEGIYQAIGPCDEVEQIFSLFGLISYRKKYFCIKELQQKLFNFHCIPGGQLPRSVNDEPLEYYAICGTNFEHRTEYITFIWIYCVTVFFIIYYVTLSCGVKISNLKTYSCTKIMEHNDHNYGFTSPKDLNSCKKKFSNDGIPQQALDDIELRHRSGMLNRGGKKSRLPTPTRLSGYLPKSSA
ncbi:putative integral membrane protein [Acanthocheilonema viteae]